MTQTNLVTLHVGPLASLVVSPALLLSHSKSFFLLRTDQEFTAALASSGYTEEQLKPIFEAVVRVMRCTGWTRPLKKV